MAKAVTVAPSVQTDNFTGVEGAGAGGEGEVGVAVVVVWDLEDLLAGEGVSSIAGTMGAP